LLRDGSGKAQPLGNGFFGELVQPIIERGIEIPNGLEQALWDEGVDAVGGCHAATN
jgi:hypothetical protein